jgi:hypothetical protein
VYGGAFYDQTDDVAIGLPPTLAIVSYCMEYFEQLAISLVASKPTHWYKYVDDTFVVLRYGKEKLQDFL